MFASSDNSRRISRRAFLLFALGSCAGLSAEQGIKRTPVQSSNLASVGYDERSRVLEVEFLHGGIYRYFGVPKATFAALMAAESKGQYFSANVRKQFRFEKVKPRSTAQGK